MRRSPPLFSLRILRSFFVEGLERISPYSTDHVTHFLLEEVYDMSQKKKPKANAHHSGHKHANNHKTSSSANKQNGYH
ncbi:hypothetical protein [Bacillus sp. FJAT-45037]|uniref:hypothetical protein n=1 Tax=Bacillus sp. FJAT-45037 TaxID=2011007 RepID=UPI000C233F05|nr:hypothetical protein [Bacillus sp. FJAT-45037]